MQAESNRLARNVLLAAGLLTIGATAVSADTPTCVPAEHGGELCDHTPDAPPSGYYLHPANYDAHYYNATTNSLDPFPIENDQVCYLLVVGVCTGLNINDDASPDAGYTAYGWVALLALYDYRIEMTVKLDGVLRQHCASWEDCPAVANLLVTFWHYTFGEADVCPPLPYFVDRPIEVKVTAKDTLNTVVLSSTTTGVIHCH